MRRMRLAVPFIILALSGVLALVARPSAPAIDTARQPAPLRGIPLRGKTGLHLLVAAKPPYVLAVDTGSTIAVRGIRPVDPGSLSVEGVGGRAAVVVTGTPSRADLYAVRSGGRVSRLGVGTAVAPDKNGRSVWVKSSMGRRRCDLRQAALDGRLVRGRRPFACASTLVSGGALGLVVNRTRLFDPVTGRTVLRTRWGVLAAAGKRLLLAGPGRQFTLTDGVTRSERRLRWPSILTGIDRPAVDPRGRLVALAFAVPAWQGGAKQALDVWLLDTRTGSLGQLPGMPAFVSLKATSMAWTADGRLVLLAESGGKEIVALWRPGQRRLAVKAVRLPKRDSGSDTFAPLG